MNLIIFRFFTKDIGVCRAELLLVEGLSEAFAALCDLLIHLLLDLSEIILDKDIGAIALL